MMYNGATLSEHTRAYFTLKPDMKQNYVTVEAFQVVLLVCHGRIKKRNHHFSMSNLEHAYRFTKTPQLNHQWEHVKGSMRARTPDQSVHNYLRIIRQQRFP